MRVMVIVKATNESEDGEIYNFNEIAPIERD
jgi:hypothetical protein